MTLRHFTAVVRHVGRLVPLTAFLGATGLVSGLLGEVAVAEEPLVTNVGRFQIPFDIETAAGQPPEGFAVLFGSQDGGVHWQQLQSVPARQNSFMFAAPRDGRYSFSIRMTDAQGNLLSAIEGSAPELEVIVDTVAPTLKLNLLETIPGQVMVNWTSSDSSLVAESLSMEYADAADGRWKPVTIQAAASGQAAIPVSPGSVISVRATIVDMAGNRTDATSQIVSKPVSATTVTGPVPFAPQKPAMPLGPTPFGDRASMNSRGTNSVVSAQAKPTNASFPANAIANYSHPATAAPATTTSPTMDSTSFPAMSVAPTATQPPPVNTLNPLLPMAGDDQLVDNQVFDLEYQVEDVGPSGVSAVELFVTENGGQQWFRYGNDPDLRSPFQVDTQGEGTFGFAVRVRNGLGFIDTPPQPGQKPEIIITVDQTVPVIEMAQPSVRADGFGTIQLSWRVSDQNPSPTPVRLEQSTTPNGPWSAVFDWQADQGGFQWAVRPGTPAALYFRLLARDAAGNVASTQTPQPVIVDLKKPVGRLLRVQTASHTRLPEN
jgi:hypothetical protein